MLMEGDSFGSLRPREDAKLSQGRKLGAVGVKRETLNFDEI